MPRAPTRAHTHLRRDPPAWTESGLSSYRDFNVRYEAWLASAYGDDVKPFYLGPESSYVKYTSEIGVSFRRNHAGALATSVSAILELVHDPELKRKFFGRWNGASVAQREKWVLEVFERNHRQSEEVGRQFLRNECPELTLENMATDPSHLETLVYSLLFLPGGGEPYRHVPHARWDRVNLWSSSLSFPPSRGVRAFSEGGIIFRALCLAEFCRQIMRAVMGLPPTVARPQKDNIKLTKEERADLGLRDSRGGKACEACARYAVWGIEPSSTAPSSEEVPTNPSSGQEQLWELPLFVRPFVDSLAALIELRNRAILEKRERDLDLLALTLQLLDTASRSSPSGDRDPSAVSLAKLSLSDPATAVESLAALLETDAEAIHRRAEVARTRFEAGEAFAGVDGLVVSTLKQLQSGQSNPSLPEEFFHESPLPLLDALLIDDRAFFALGVPSRPGTSPSAVPTHVFYLPESVPCLEQVLASLRWHTFELLAAGGKIWASLGLVALFVGASLGLERAPTRAQLEVPSVWYTLRCQLREEFGRLFVDVEEGMIEGAVEAAEEAVTKTWKAAPDEREDLLMLKEALVHVRKEAMEMDEAYEVLQALRGTAKEEPRATEALPAPKKRRNKKKKKKSKKKAEDVEADEGEEAGAEE
ncbi:hypothetical protein JCM8097_006169 [Rhodosporidiobolus ruineniae]